VFAEVGVTVALVGRVAQLFAGEAFDVGLFLVLGGFGIGVGVFLIFS
jgi:hypothetical protein